METKEIFIALLVFISLLVSIKHFIDKRKTGGQLPTDDDEKGADTGGQLPPDDDE